MTKLSAVMLRYIPMPTWNVMFTFEGNVRRAFVAGKLTHWMGTCTVFSTKRSTKRVTLTLEGSNLAPRTGCTGEWITVVSATSRK